MLMLHQNRKPLSNQTSFAKVDEKSQIRACNFSIVQSLGTMHIIKFCNSF